jgi:Pyruvate/2-oxoacid:ferredoxin oxidoreductase gamma subunit
VNFLKTVYTSCSSLELDKNKRLSVEKERLEQEYFDQVMALEKEQYASKQKFLGKVLGGAKNSNDSKKKELQDKMNRELEELEKEITEIVASDTKMVGKNMKLYARIDNILKNNVLCFKIK